MANAVLTLNQMSNGRALIGISGGGGVLGATGWKIRKDGPIWPIKDEIKGNRYPERRVRGVQECIEVLELARSGKARLLVRRRNLPGHAAVPDQVRHVRDRPTDIRLLQRADDGPDGRTARRRHPGQRFHRRHDARRNGKRARRPRQARQARHAAGQRRFPRREFLGLSRQGGPGRVDVRGAPRADLARRDRGEIRARHRAARRRRGRGRGRHRQLGQFLQGVLDAQRPDRRDLCETSSTS